MSNMKGDLKKIECAPKCGFMVRSHDEKEIVELAIQHAKKSHNETLSEKEAKEMIANA
jgi:predicted small metal-binding protein